MIGNLLRHHQIRLGREEALVKHLRRNHHLVIKVVLLDDLVIGLQGSGRNLHRIGENLLTILNLLHLVVDGLLFVFDLSDGVDALCRIIDNAGAELRVRSRFDRRGNPDGKCCKDESFHNDVLSLR